MILAAPPWEPAPVPGGCDKGLAYGGVHPAPLPETSRFTGSTRGWSWPPAAPRGPRLEAAAVAAAATRPRPRRLRAAGRPTDHETAFESEIVL